MGNDFFRNANILPPSGTSFNKEDGFAQLNRFRYKKHPYQCRELLLLWEHCVREETGTNLSLAKITVAEQDCVSVCAYGLLYLLTYDFRFLCRNALMPSVSLMHDDLMNPFIVIEAEKKPNVFFHDIDFVNPATNRLGEACGFWVSREESVDRFRLIFHMKRYRCDDFSVYQEMSDSIFRYVRAAISEENMASSQRDKSEEADKNGE